MYISEHYFTLKNSLNVLNVEIEHDIINQPASNEYLAKVKSHFQVFPEILIDFYSKNNGIKFQWYFENDKDCFVGKIHISSIEFLLGWNGSNWNENSLEDIIWSNDEDETTLNTIDLRKKLKLFDNNSAQQIFILIDISNGKLYLWHNNNLEEMLINISEYFENAFKFFGITYWQYLFINKESSLKKHCINQIEKLFVTT